MVQAVENWADIRGRIVQLDELSEAEPFVDKLKDAYCRTLASDRDANALLERAQFYRATSTLRIARNGWLSRQERMTLVAEGMALLVSNK